MKLTEAKNKLRDEVNSSEVSREEAAAQLQAAQEFAATIEAKGKDLEVSTQEVQAMETANKIRSAELDAIQLELDTAKEELSEGLTNAAAQLQQFGRTPKPTTQHELIEHLFNWASEVAEREAVVNGTEQDLAASSQKRLDLLEEESSMVSRIELEFQELQMRFNKESALLGADSLHAQMEGLLMRNNEHTHKAQVMQETVDKLSSQAMRHEQLLSTSDERFEKLHDATNQLSTQLTEETNTRIELERAAVRDQAAHSRDLSKIERKLTAAEYDNVRLEERLTESLNKVQCLRDEVEGLEQSLRSEQQRAQSEIHAQHDANTKAEQLLQQQISALENVVQRTQEEPLKSPDGPTDELRFEHAREKLEYEEKELVLKQGELALKLLKIEKAENELQTGAAKLERDQEQVSEQHKALKEAEASLEAARQALTEQA